LHGGLGCHERPSAPTSAKGAKVQRAKVEAAKGSAPADPSPRRPPPTAHLAAYQYKPGESGNPNRGPDRLPRGVKLWGRMTVTALAMDEVAMMKAMIRRMQQMVASPSDFAFLRLCEIVKATLEPPEGKNGHTERPPLAQIIVNGKPVMPPAEPAPKAPGPDYEEGGVTFTAVDPP
jgi:hypothetical protein